MPLLNTGDRINGVTDALISDIVLQLLSYVAQVEREDRVGKVGVTGLS